MRDSDALLRAGKSMQWNTQRATRCLLIQAGIHPGIEPNDNGFYAVSYHTSINSAYVTQHRIRAVYPELETHVKKSVDTEWVAVVYVKRKAQSDAA